ncbi:MAG TPA: family 10 glycosylhydrolase, partial [Bacteroidota bacterium]|nr:family 10 glycosylhydrolase [Bacteroidota bacterium]
MLTVRCAKALLVIQLLTPGAHGVLSSQSTSQPKYEVRAVWITTVNGLDWPSSHDAAEQKRSLREMVEKLHAAHFNTIFFQVRGRGDALFPSNYEPWAEVLTGVPGKDPGWDPLQFIIDEAHTRAMEIHAWFNTFYVKSGKGDEPSTRPRHVTAQHPEWINVVEGGSWLDPGIPAVREYVLRVALDIVRRYDLDGIQFDFMRYPGNLFDDDVPFKRYGGRLTRDDWRRENVNAFIRAFYDSAIAIKPILKIGSTPIGIYRNAGTMKGRQGYDELFQDARGWLKEKANDYVVPQVYWSLGNQAGDPDFREVTKDWTSHAYGRHVIIGVAAYKPDVNKHLSDLIDVSRSLQAQGNSFFRYGNIKDVLALGGRYRYPAVIPPMPWKDSTAPNPPADLVVAGADNGAFELHWTAPSPASDGDRAAYYNVYRSTGTSIDMNDPANLIAIIPSTELHYSDTVRHVGRPHVAYAVTSSDRGHNESKPAPVQRVLIPQVAQLAQEF